MESGAAAHKLPAAAAARNVTVGRLIALRHSASISTEEEEEEEEEKVPECNAVVGMLHGDKRFQIIRFTYLTSRTLTH